MKKQPHVNVYVPESFYMEGKEEMPCRLFREDLAVLLPSHTEYTILAARGLYLKAGNKIPISDEDSAFVESSLLNSSRCLIVHKDRPLILFGDLYRSCGLLLALLPHHDPTAVSLALPYVLAARTELAPSAQKIACKHASAQAISECYSALSEQFAECNRIVQVETDFRLHVAHIAQYAGTLANVTDLPIGDFPLSPYTHGRWSLFLLCVFLALRGDSATPSQLHLKHADRREFQLRLAHKSEASRKIPVTQELFGFLDLPCFSDFKLSKTENGFILEATLPRSSAPPALHADPRADRVILEILPISHL